MSANVATRPTRRPTRAAAGSRARPKARSRSKYFGISRIDSKATHGWFARLGYHETRRGQRARFVAFFPDLRCGGKGKALQAAQAWVAYVLRRGRVPRRDVGSHQPVLSRSPSMTRRKGRSSAS